MTAVRRAALRAHLADAASTLCSWRQYLGHRRALVKRVRVDAIVALIVAVIVAQFAAGRGLRTRVETA